MPGMPPAPLAVLAQRDAIRVVALGLVGLIVPALALLAGEGHSDPDVSAGHGETALREGRDWRRAKENPAPARGRARRIARARSPARRRGDLQRPRPDSMCGMVRRRIFMSLHSDQLAA